MKYISVLVVFVFFFNCKNDTKKEDIKSMTASEIITKSIEVSGGEKFNNSTINFTFRDKDYSALRNYGKFSFGRKFKDSLSEISDIITNKEFKRLINSEMVPLSEKQIDAYTASVNSVHYFSVLPYGLNDKAVNKKLIGEEKIKDNDYYKIEVTFNQKGGGEDFEDVFIYWIHKATLKPDYLAYSYNEADGKGMRFREAYNERVIKGLRFVDYNNYKPENKNAALTSLASDFEKGSLKLLSKIELENVEVTIN